MRAQGFSRKMLLTSLLTTLVVALVTSGTTVATHADTNIASNVASNVASKTYTATMSAPHTPAGQNGGTDDYHCFLIDPKVTQDSLILSSQFVPQNPSVVHHAILFQIGAANVAQAQQLNAGGDGWSCFGGSGLGGNLGSFLTSPWLSSWAPGRGKDVMPKGFATSFKKGSQIVLQVHYNLLMAGKDSVLKDQSKVILNAIPAKGSKLKILNSDLVAAPVELACPTGITGPLCSRKASLADLAARTSSQSAFESAGLNLLCGQDAINPKPSLTSTCDKTITVNETVIQAAPHMHLLGTALKLIANPGTSREKVILSRPNYNFDDQSATVLKNPIQLKAGDTVRVICTFNPKLRQLLPGLKNLPARYVTWGEGSSDEMCLGVMGVSVTR